MQIDATADCANNCSPTKFIICKTLIRPILLYGSEGVDSKKMNQFLVFERKLLRTKCGLKIKKMLCTGGGVQQPVCHQLREYD
jgi:hypothetical protein